MLIDPRRNALDGVNDAVQDAQHHVPARVLDGLVEVILNALECLIDDPGNKRRKAAQGRADGFGNAAVKPTEIQFLSGCHQVFADLLPVYSLDGLCDKLKRTGECIQNCLTDPGPVHILDEFVDALPQRRAGLAELEILNRGLDDGQRHIEIFRQRRAHVIPVHAGDQVGQAGADIRADAAPVDAVHRLVDLFDQRVDAGGELNAQGSPVERRQEIPQRLQRGLEPRAQGVAQQRPVHLIHKAVKALGQLRPQVRPVDLGQQLVHRVQDCVDPGPERPADQIPVDAAHQAVENPGNDVHRLGDLLAQRVPADHGLGLFKRAVDALADDTPDTVVVGRRPQVLERLDPVRDAVADLLGLVDQPAAGARTAAAPAAAVLVAQDLQLVETGQLPLEVLHLAAGLARRAADAVQPGHGLLIAALPGQRREKSADDVDGSRQPADQRRQRRRHRREDRREGGSQAALQAVQRGAQAIHRALDRGVRPGHLRKAVLDGAAEPIEKHKKAADTQAVPQQVLQRHPHAAVGRFLGPGKAQHGPRRPAQQRAQALDAAARGVRGQPRQLDRGVFRT